MAVMNVNPTRMELTKLKKKLSVAVRGHKLLKDKRDELMRQFLDVVRKNKELRLSVEKALEEANSSMAAARSVMSRKSFYQALIIPKQDVKITVEEKNVMSVDVPVFKSTYRTNDKSDIYPYGLASTSFELDDGVMKLSEVLPKLIMLAQQENAAQLLASEIEKTRRRVNALEYVIIPDTRDTIRFITMKLDENERANTTRLMKVKDMMLTQTIEEKKQENLSL